MIQLILCNHELEESCNDLVTNGIISYEQNHIKSQVIPPTEKKAHLEIQQGRRGGNRSNDAELTKNRREE